MGRQLSKKEQLNGGGYQDSGAGQQCLAFKLRSDCVKLGAQRSVHGGEPEDLAACLGALLRHAGSAHAFGGNARQLFLGIGLAGKAGQRFAVHRAKRHAQLHQPGRAVHVEPGTDYLSARLLPWNADQYRPDRRSGSAFCAQRQHHRAAAARLAFSMW